MALTVANRPPVDLPARDAARLLGTVVVPILAQGVIARRPRMVALAGRLGTDDRGVRALQGLRERHGPGPLRLRLPGRTVVVLLDPADVATVLAGGPFAPASLEKRGALGHFQPHGVLASDGPEREPRRAWNEAVLETGRPRHSRGDVFGRAVAEEMGHLRDATPPGSSLTWDAFAVSWWRAVRRIVLGDRARDDHALTDTLTRLRRSANWAGLAPRRPARYAALRAGLRRHLDRAGPGSLAEMIAATAPGPEIEPADQVAHWLFAFDAAAAVTLRALALLAAHPDADRDGPGLRAAVLESARLWPTTPLILRDTTAETPWGPAGTAVAIPTWYLHRDSAHRADADRFAPGQWRDRRADADPGLVPFSAGPAACPGRDLVTATAATALGVLLDGRGYASDPALPGGGRPLPRGLNPYALRLAAR